MQQQDEMTYHLGRAYFMAKGMKDDFLQYLILMALADAAEKRPPDQPRSARTDVAPRL
jgi:hypothetical protein